MKTAVLVEQAPHHRPWLRAFAEGLRKHGWHAEVTRNPAACDMLVLWGTRRMAAIRAHQQEAQVCILERGYIGNRRKWTSVSFGGGLNNRGIFRGPFHDASRWDKHFGHLIEPWRGHITGSALILGQVPSDMSVKGVDVRDFYGRAALAFESRGFPVEFRPHPLAPLERCAGTKVVGGDLAKALAGAALTVSWNSNASVEAVLAGVPSVTMDECSMAWDVTGHELAFPPMPEREKWAVALAWKQYTEDEMESGFCWEAITEAESCVRVA